MNENQGINLDIALDYYGSANFTKVFYRLSDQRVFVDNRIPAFENSLSIQNAASTPPLVPVARPLHSVSARNDNPASIRFSLTSAFAASRSFSHPLCAYEVRENKHDINMYVQIFVILNGMSVINSYICRLA